MKNLNQILRCLDIPEMIHFDSVVADAIQTIRAAKVKRPRSSKFLKVEALNRRSLGLA